MIVCASFVVIIISIFGISVTKKLSKFQMMSQIVKKTIKKLIFLVFVFLISIILETIYNLVISTLIQMYYIYFSFN